MKEEQNGFFDKPQKTRVIGCPSFGMINNNLKQ
jgi:hypothetical protein